MVYAFMNSLKKVIRALLQKDCLNFSRENKNYAF